jgi:hypothetical protein
MDYEFFERFKEYTDLNSGCGNCNNWGYWEFNLLPWRPIKLTKTDTKCSSIPREWRSSRSKLSTSVVWECILR